jgi:hypothetical protein
MKGRLFQQRLLVASFVDAAIAIDPEDGASEPPPHVFARHPVERAHPPMLLRP